jgi:tripartite-type tricarboxylate transporter receptor subunit TctC
MRRERDGGTSPRVQRTWRTGILALAIAVVVATMRVHAAGPTMTIVVAAVPGGALDRTARLLAQRFEADLGRTVVIENRAGGSTRIASDYVLKSARDGDTLLLTTGTSTIDLAFDANAHPNILADFVPVALVTEGQYVLLVRALSPLRGVADVIARARAAPGVLNYGSVDVQSTQRVIGELFKLRTGTDIVQIPYKSEVAIPIAVANGDLDFGIVGVGSALPFIQAGKVRPIAVTSARRSPVLPDVPTLTETGVSIEQTQWYGMLVPADTPAATVDALARAVERAAKSPQYRKAIQSMGMEPASSTPSSFGAMLNAEVARFREVIETTHLRP